MEYVKNTFFPRIETQEKSHTFSLETPWTIVFQLKQEALDGGLLYFKLEKDAKEA